MSKKSKILCVILVLVFIMAIISTGIRGLNVDLNYGNGVSLVFDIGKEFENSDIKNIAQEIWNDGKTVVQKVEIYDETALIKVKEASNEQIEKLANKLNEKYELDLKGADITVLYNSNYRLRDLITPYIVPALIGTVLIVVYYSVRYKGIKEILQLLLTLIAVEGIIYSIYALIQIPINFLTMPIAMIAYVSVVTGVTIKNEIKVKKHKK